MIRSILLIGLLVAGLSSPIARTFSANALRDLANLVEPKDSTPERFREIKIRNPFYWED